MFSRVSWWVLDFRVTVLFVCCVVSMILSHDVPLRPREMVSLLEEGRRQYNLVQSKTTMPAFGSCWKTAIARLQSGCQQLDDKIQSEVALSFANCFLEGAGLPRHDCHGSDKSLPAKKEDCLKTMHDKAFIAYTEFFTHTQSMCFFVMSQIWHEETEKTIDRQAIHQCCGCSKAVGGVGRASRGAFNASAKECCHSAGAFRKWCLSWKASTLEQQRLLSMVFHHLSTLQSWIVGEVSWVDSIAFYIPSFAFVYFLTSAQRTAKARVPGLLVLLFAGLVERFVSYILLSDGADGATFQPVDIVNERLRWWVWFVRRFAIAANILVLFITLYRYQDREEVMHKLLEQIRRQNEELLYYIHGKEKGNGLKQQKSLDEADGFGYMPVPTSSSSSLSGHATTPTSQNSPRISHIKPIARAAPASNGLISSVKMVHIGIPTAQSAFKPIRENSPANETVNSSIAVDTTTEENDSIGVFTNINSSTPKKQNKKRNDVSINSSTVSTRYNLRRSGRISAVSPV
ncbi:Protein GAMETE EXPRESSED 1 [Frankliniella fusca]|uniref:Protein GAMETE EXPRESSED 1 n=1 Tax=Frankliniella fusca TaxID=407009 RepID=A0AAE1L898_9NEOP|nr:Protein GAMETE EXPRESSED 1 [Frankliniella fusca]